MNLQIIYIKVVDDFLPISRDRTLMCTFSTNKDELWPSIIEKAVSYSVVFAVFLFFVNIIFIYLVFEINGRL
jgi:hypothetical protein